MHASQVWDPHFQKDIMQCVQKCRYAELLNHFKVGHFSRSQTIGFPILLIHFEPPRISKSGINIDISRISVSINSSISSSTGDINISISSIASAQVVSISASANQYQHRWYQYQYKYIPLTSLGILWNRLSTRRGFKTSWSKSK